jgi:hypothetical protein
MDFNDLEAIIVHHSATRPNQNVTASIIDGWHRARGWLGIGYHWVIRRDGCIEAGRFINEHGAHAPGWNDRSVGIFMIGGLNEDEEVEDNFTDEQYRALRALVFAINPSLPLKLHKDVAATECSMVNLERVRP